MEQESNSLTTENTFPLAASENDTATQLWQSESSLNNVFFSAFPVIASKGHGLLSQSLEALR